MNKNPLEWTVFACSVGLILGCVALLVYQQVVGGHSPPSISVTTGETTDTSDGFAVTFEIRNDGDTTAEAVAIEAVLSWPGGTERGETTLAYVPYHSTRRAWIVFTRDPRQSRLKARVLGYREP